MNILLSHIKTTIDNLNALSNDDFFKDSYEAALNTIVGCLKNGGHIYLCGNGGSFSDALHMAGELNGKIYSDRNPLPAHVLGSDGATLTAIANDYSYDQVFARELKGKMKENDILIAISTSGNSKNVVEALKVAVGKTILLTGPNSSCDGAQYCDILIPVVGTRADEIQTLHQVVYHSLIYNIEEKLNES